MSAEHFRELIITVCITNCLTHKKLAGILGVTTATISNWKKYGVPKPRAVRVYNQLKLLCREHQMWKESDINN